MIGHCNHIIKISIHASRLMPTKKWIRGAQRQTTHSIIVYRFFQSSGSSDVPAYRLIWTPGRTKLSISHDGTITTALLLLDNGPYYYYRVIGVVVLLKNEAMDQGECGWWLRKVKSDARFLFALTEKRQRDVGNVFKIRRWGWSCNIEE